MGLDKPSVLQTLDERIAVAAERNAPQKVDLVTGENGNVLVDKDLNPEIYD